MNCGATFGVLICDRERGHPGQHRGYYETADEILFWSASSVQQFEELGRAGFTVSICCGPSGEVAFRWSIDVLAPSGEHFDRPYAASSFEHAVAIAVAEIAARGWVGRETVDGAQS
jgi:hypothetical protein